MASEKSVTSETAQDLPDDSRVDAAAVEGSGTLSFLGNDPRPLNYLLEGWALPPKRPGSTNWETHIANLRQLQLRDDDIFLCAYPKAGTHWLWEVLSMLTRGLAEYDSRPKEQLMMEFADIERLEQTPSPRIFNSHLPLFMLPWQQIKEKKSKVVHVYRNPKDLCVSYFHHMKGRENDLFNDMEFSKYFEVFFYERVHFDNCFAYLKQMYKFTQENPDVPVLSMSFEDMKKNPAENVKKLAKFLEMDVSDKICEDIAEACSFQNLKKNAEFKKHEHRPHHHHEDVSNKDGNKSGEKRRPNSYRKGEIGDWKNYFTVAMCERVDPFIETQLEGLPFTMQYS